MNWKNFMHSVQRLCFSIDTSDIIWYIAIHYVIYIYDLLLYVFWEKPVNKHIDILQAHP